MRRGLLALLALLAGCLAEYTVGGAADGSACPDGQVQCADGCVAAGACEGCGDGQELCAGACVAHGSCDDGPCAAGQVACGGACVAADACPCDEGCDADLEACVAGVCVCRDGLERCGSDCVDTRADADHCGGCGGACTGAEPLCQAGDCVAACAAPGQACDGACVDTGRDPLHCGECSDACKSDELCVSGECHEYVEIAGCDACPCEDACGDGGDDGGEGHCCDSSFLGAPVCLPDGCG